jgi:hypothetical protein
MNHSPQRRFKKPFVECRNNPVYPLVFLPADGRKRLRRIKRDDE